MRSRVGKHWIAILIGFAMWGLVRPVTLLASDPNAPPDEAKRIGLNPHYFLPAQGQYHDYFPDMDAVSVPVEGDSGQAWPDQLLDRAPAGPDHRPARKLDRTLVKSDSEILGRNTWMLWCGGNEQFWGEWLPQNNHGFVDFLKLLDTRNRSTRWRDVGLVNEPGMRQAAAPDEFGLWLDQAKDDRVNQYRRDLMKKAVDTGFAVPQGGGFYDARAFSAQEDPALKRFFNGFDEPYVRGIPPAQVYGFSSGVIGLRLFPNPKFKPSKWKPDRYYCDPAYYNDPKLERPYRVGMSCVFCHATAHPLNPPADKNNPQWENLSATIGNQYLRIRGIFGNLLTPDNFVYHVLDSQPPGTIDTSLVASDNINNPNAMNAIFGVPARVVRAFQNPPELANADSARIPNYWGETFDPAKAPPCWTQLPDDPSPDAYRKLIPGLTKANDNPRFVPRVLLDGADSIGAQGALARVYLNIGTYSEQWVRLHEPLIGFLPPQASTEPGRTQLPFRIEDCEKNSVYWQATRLRVPAVRDYFLKVTAPMPLLDARANDIDVGERVDTTKLKRGRQVFARNCIACHSSIQPETGLDFITDAAKRQALEKDDAIQAAIQARLTEFYPLDEAKYGSSDSPGKVLARANHEMWDHDPGRWLKNPDYREWATKVVEEPDFWRNNFLSSDYRVPITLVQTNSGRAMATNAVTGHMWEDFSSEDYRHMPSVGAIEFFNPFTRKFETFTPRHKTPDGVETGGGGPGFYRPPSLISIWATAPFLHNNSLGHFTNDPSVSGRLVAFDDAIHKLLYPERRLQSSDYAPAGQLVADQGLIWRTPCETWLTIRGQDVPLYLRRMPLPTWLLDLGETLTGIGRLRALVPLLFLLAAFVLLWKVRGHSWRAYLTRRGAYGLILIGLLIGFLAYLDEGRLGSLRIGPIPAGTPVNLLANVNPDAPPAQIKAAVRDVVDGITQIQTQHLTGPAVQDVINKKIGPALLSVSKCPDFVMDKGHYYPWFNDMTDEDKEALIELLKTF